MAKQQVHPHNDEKSEKTNVMRLLDQRHLPYIPHHYNGTAALSGIEVAAAIGMDAQRVFKTLVCTCASGTLYVFVIPAPSSLNLKRAARCVGEKYVEMLPAKDLLPRTGYVHGGCSPIGMKKQQKTVLHVTAWNYDTICVSAGKIGSQIECSAQTLSQIIPLTKGDIADPPSAVNRAPANA